MLGPLAQLKGRLKGMAANPLARNTGWMMLGQGARIPIQALYFILIARSLGTQGYGAFVGVTALVAILAPFASLGSGDILIKNVARDEASFRAYWGKALCLTCVSGSILLVVAGLLSKLLLPAGITLPLVISVAVADLIFSRLLDVSAQAFQAFQRLARTSQLMVLSNIARLILLALLLIWLRHPSPVVWGYFYLAGIGVSAVAAILLVNRELGTPVFKVATIFSDLKQGLFFSISLSSQNIYNDIDKTMLAKLGTLEAAGIYGAAYRIIDVAFTPVRSLLYASYARFFQSGAVGVGGTLRLARKLLPFAASYGLAVSLALYLSAPLLPIFLGAQYAETVTALRWLSLLPLLKVMHYFAADSLTGAGRQGVRSACQVTTAGFNFLSIIWLIPIYSWKGAAWASVASDGLLAILLWSSVLFLSKNEAEVGLLIVSD
jgi:O-antigen/teichoic acid export membrane protein